MGYSKGWRRLNLGLSLYGFAFDRRITCVSLRLTSQNSIRRSGCQQFYPFEGSFARLRSGSAHRTRVSTAPTFEVVRARPWGAYRYAIVGFGPREHTLDGEFLHTPSTLYSTVFCSVFDIFWCVHRVSRAVWYPFCVHRRFHWHPWRAITAIDTSIRQPWLMITVRDARGTGK